MNKHYLNFTIRSIESKDNKVLQNIIQKSLEEYHLDKPGTAYYDPQLAALYEFYKNQYKSSYWVAVDQSKQIVVGGIGIGPFGNYENIAELQKYYILKEYQNQGIGRLLFQQATDFACHNGFESLYIETMDSLRKANSIYEHLGFKRLAQPLKGSQHDLMNRWYIKDL